ncbi:MAG: GNAT family N-acetyltransferase [Actinobacteria bacterium]|nr:GNAT family N-acetyltransferase [Actinomycetota bacterium]
MRRTLVRMERPADGVEAAVVPGVEIRPWRRSDDHPRIPGVYAAAFGHDPWPDDWDRFEGFDPGGVFVAEERGALAGFCICFPRADDGYLSVVAVVPQARRRGIASALVAAAVERLASLGREVVRIDAYQDAPAAVGAYRSLGFTTYDVVADDDADPRGSAEE